MQQHKPEDERQEASMKYIRPRAFDGASAASGASAVLSEKVMDEGMGNVRPDSLWP
jgi:hypothetical protein